jgi:hypothetical protein
LVISVLRGGCWPVPIVSLIDGINDAVPAKVTSVPRTILGSDDFYMQQYMPTRGSDFAGEPVVVAINLVSIGHLDSAPIAISLNHMASVMNH